MSDQPGSSAPTACLQFSNKRSSPNSCPFNSVENLGVNYLPPVRAAKQWFPQVQIVQDSLVSE